MIVVAEQFLKHLVINYGKHKVKYLQMAVHGIPPPQACKFLKLKHHQSTYFSFEKVSHIEIKNSPIF